MIDKRIRHLYNRYFRGWTFESRAQAQFNFYQIYCYDDVSYWNNDFLTTLGPKNERASKIFV